LAYDLISLLVPPNSENYTVCLKKRATLLWR